MQNEKNFLTGRTEFYSLVKKAKRSVMMKNISISFIVSFILYGFFYWKSCTFIGQIPPKRK